MCSSLVGKVAVISGASRGIGRAIALKFASEGADLAICARSAQPLQELQKQVQAMGQNCLSMPVDMTDVSAIERFCATTRQTYTKVNILINNAGIYLDRSTFEQSDPQLWWETISTNLRGPYLLSRHLLAAMPEGAKIINSLLAKALVPDRTAALITYPKQH